MAKKSAKKAGRKKATKKKSTRKKATNKKATRKKAAKKSKRGPKKKRGRPTDANLIKNLEARIKEVKERMSKRNQKDLTHVKSAFRALKAINTAMAASKKADDAHMRHALADGFRAIAGHFKSQGYKAPAARLPRGRRPK